MNIAVEGQKYEGKTSLAFWLAMLIKDRTNAYKVLIFDPKWAFRNHSIEVLGQVRSVAWAETSEDFEQLLAEQGSAAVYRPRMSFSESDEEIMWEEFEQFSRAISLEKILRFPFHRPVILLIDEAYFLQSGKTVHPALSSAIRLATEGKLFIILAVHGPRELAPMVRRQLDEMYLFRQNDPADLDFIQERCGAEARAIVEKLPQHHLLVFRSRSRDFEVWSNPERWRIHIND